LEENKNVIIASNDTVATDQADALPLSTTSEAVLPDGDVSGEDLVATSTSESSAVAEKSFDVEKTISDVQLVNEYISYDAISSLIDLLQQGVTGSREQATSLLRGKIAEQSEQSDALKEAVVFINDNFLIHKAHIQSQIKLAEKAIKKANDDLYLGYLKDSLAALTQAKQLVYEATTVMQFVAHNKGLIEDKKIDSTQEKIAPKVTPKLDPTASVKMQTVDEVVPEAVVPEVSE
jgi:hypothetical protein